MALAIKPTWECAKCRVPFRVEDRRGELCFYCESGRDFARCLGISSRCADGKHVLMLDFDDIGYRGIYDKATLLAEEFAAEAVHILESSRGSYHLVSFEKFSAAVARDLYAGMGGDSAHFHSEKIRGDWTLRFSPKGNSSVRYIDTVRVFPSPLAPRESSYVHWRFYSILHGEIRKYVPRVLDDSRFVRIQGFYSRKVLGKHRAAGGIADPRGESDYFSSDIDGRDLYDTR